MKIRGTLKRFCEHCRIVRKKSNHKLYVRYAPREASRSIDAHITRDTIRDRSSPPS